MPRGRGAWDAERIRAAVQATHLDSFGHVGSRLLWDRLGVPEAPLEFCGRAERCIEQVLLKDSSALAQQTTGAGWRKHQRVFAYAEYDLEPPPGEEEIRGRMLFENGFRAIRGDQRWLKHTPLPLNSWVDRSLCSEMQLLTILCTQLNLEGLAAADDAELNETLRGSLWVYTSSPPCISCVGVLWQFRLLFPNMELQFSSGSWRGVEAWTRH
mmetsp:Transcript_121613/g.378105  ORF Transcript_121613/g.378105 Transcript_121613/m.378105 type:complete len:212 (+) Transcript_121613:1-636(+)